MQLRMSLLMTLVGFGIGGCATVNPQPCWQQVEVSAVRPADTLMIWEQTAADAEAIRSQVDSLIADGLSRHDAVHLAVLNNRQLQAAFEDLGMAEADVVQAGLFTNPSLDAFLGFPLSNGDSSGGLLVFLSDLWTLPARKAVAARQADVTLQQVGAAMVMVIAEALQAYDEVLYRRAVLELEQSVLTVRTETAARMQIRHNHGLENEINVQQSHRAVADQYIALAEAQQNLTIAQMRLRTVLSLPYASYQLTDLFEPFPEAQWTEDTALSFALEHRVDLAQARLRIEQAERQGAFERTQVFSLVGVGVGYDGDFAVENSKGPNLSLELPLFDQNQAQIAKAEYRQRQAQKDLAAAEMQVRKEISDVLAERTFHSQQLTRLQNDIHPAIAKEVAYAEYWSPRMQVTVMTLLTARAQALMYQRRYLDTLWQLRGADVRLYQALWGGKIM